MFEFKQGPISQCSQRLSIIWDLLRYRMACEPHSPGKNGIMYFCYISAANAPILSGQSGKTILEAWGLLAILRSPFLTVFRGTKRDDRWDELERMKSGNFYAVRRTRSGRIIYLMQFHLYRGVVLVEARLDDSDPLTLQLICNGESVAQASGKHLVRLSVPLNKPVNARSYFRVIIASHSGGLLITNPLSLN